MMIYMERLFKQPSNGREAVKEIDSLLANIEQSKNRVCKTVKEINIITNGAHNGKAIHSSRD